MSGRARPPVVVQVVGTAEIADLLVDRVRMKPELVLTIGTVHQIAKDALFTIRSAPVGYAAEYPIGIVLFTDDMTIIRTTCLIF